jgi:hypothetical protein
MIQNRALAENALVSYHMAAAAPGSSALGQPSLTS